MRILKQYETIQFSMKVVKSEEQIEEIVSTRPMTDEDNIRFKMNNDISSSNSNSISNSNSNINTATATTTKSDVETRVVNLNLNDNFKPNFQQTEKLFASKQYDFNNNLNERKTVQDNSVPSNSVPSNSVPSNSVPSNLSFNITIKRS